MPTPNNTSRRHFLATASAVIAAPALSRAAAPAPQTVRVAVVGLGRGMAHVNAYAQIPGVELAALCDVDSIRLAAAAKAAQESGASPATHTDFRKLLDDPTIDAISIATANFTHAPFTILACLAGKHVYVEKPGSWSAHEANWMVKVAAETGRKVQMGNQRRSLPGIREAIQQLGEGAIGPVRAARCFYNNTRPTIGIGKPATPPAHIDFDLWHGPVPASPFVDNLLHYNWHWLWDWGNGELGNNGVHALDLARWGLGVDTPLTTTCTGGRYHHDDDQQTPDTAVAAFDFGHCYASWEGSSCHPRRPEKNPFVAFYGQDGAYLTIEGAGYRIFDPQGTEIASELPAFSDLPHFTNFIDAIREDTPLNAEIADAQRSALLCHYGNIAYRTGTAIHIDPASAALVTPSPAALDLWARPAYRDGWLPGT